MAEEIEQYEEGSRIGRALGLSRDSEASAHVTLVAKGETTKAEQALVTGYGEEVNQKEKARVKFDLEKKPSDQTLEPRFDLGRLYALINQNNALGQLVSAMEINIDGTGFEIMRADGDEANPSDPLFLKAQAFFDEPWPNVPFRKIRRELRRDQEATGNAFLEVIRNMVGDIVLVRRLPAESMRMLRLSKPRIVRKRLEREGFDSDIDMPVRERRFVQLTSDGPIYFTEYGSSRFVNKKDGEWVEDPASLPMEERSSEVLHFTVQRDVHSPYGVPRWVNQIPSVLGSRKAEELNLDFFNAGGLPPALIMVQGGTMATETRRQLQNYLTGKGSSINRAAIIETYSTAGSIESAGAPVRVTVERFGAERQNDSMFEKYDERSEQRVRSSFRLPPLFVGRTEDFNFATARASYLVAEAQVFQPEREEFDDIINRTLLREIAPDFVMVSNPLTVNDVEHQLKALGMAKSFGGVSTEELLRTANTVGSLNLQYEEEFDPQVNPPELPPGPGQRIQRVEKRDSASKAMSEFTATMASQYGQWLRGAGNITDPEARDIRQTIDSMGVETRVKFEDMVNEVVFGSSLTHDPSGVNEIMREVEAVMHSGHSHGDQE